MPRSLGWNRAALLVGAPLLLFGLLELGLRVGGYRHEPWAAFAGGRTHDEFVEARVYAPDDELLWTLRRSDRIDAPEQGFPRVRTNAHGLRGPDLPGRKPPGERRILCLGDSVTFGLGLLDGETWPAQLAKELGDGFRVVNAAVPGWSCIQGMRLLERLESLEPDVILFWFGINDAKQARGVPDSASRPSSAWAARVLRLSRVVQLLQAWVAEEPDADLRRVSESEFRDAVRRLREGDVPVLFVRYPERLLETIRELDSIVQQAEGHGVGLVRGPERLLSAIVPAGGRTDLRGRVVGATLQFGSERSTVTRTLADLRTDLDRLHALKRGLDRRLDHLPDDSLGYPDLFGDASPDIVFDDNCHLTPLGAQLAAEALAKAVRRMLSRPGARRATSR